MVGAKAYYLRHVFYFILLLAASSRSHSTYNAERATLGHEVRALKREIWLIVTWNSAATVESLRWHNEKLGLTPFFVGASFVVPYAIRHQNESIPLAKEATALSGVHVVYADSCPTGPRGDPIGSRKTFAWCKHTAVATALNEISRLNEGFATKTGYLVLSDDSVIVDFPKLASVILEEGKSVAFCEESVFEVLNTPPRPFWQWGRNNTQKGLGCAASLRNLPAFWRSRYIAAVGCASAMPNRPPCTADFFYLDPNAASAWGEVAALFGTSNDEACLGAMIALVSTSSANVSWLPQPWQLWDPSYELVVESSKPSLQHHLRPANAHFPWSPFKPHANSTTHSVRKLLYIENNPDVILAHPFKLSVKMERDWTLAHYEGNWARWWGERSSTSP